MFVTATRIYKAPRIPMCLSVAIVKLRCTVLKTKKFSEVSKKLKMSASGKSLLGLWLYRSGEQEWAVKQGSPLHAPHSNKKDPINSTGSVSASIGLQSISKTRRIQGNSNNIVVLLPPQEKPGFNKTIVPAGNDAGLQQCAAGDKVSIIFTLKNQVGNLARALQVFEELGINVMHLELSPLENSTNQVRFRK